MKKELFAAGLVAAAMTGGAQASILSITAFGGFVDGSAGGFPPPAVPLPPDAPAPFGEGFPDTINYYGCAGGVCTSFSWGTPTTTQAPFSGQSGASINIEAYGDDSGNDGTRNPVNPPIANAIVWNPNTLGEVFVLGSLTHFNLPITGDPFPDPDTGLDDGFVGTVEVEYDFQIDKLADDGVTLIGSANFSSLFDLVFFETLNSLDPCPTNPGDSGNCGDTFQFFGDEVINFDIAGQKYSIEVIGFCSGTSLDTCADPGIFYSAEGQSSVGLVLEIKEAPTPGVIALISAGLIGLGFARRRQAKA